MTALKNIGAVLGGFVLTFILTIATDMLLECTGVFPTVEEQKKHGFKILWMNILVLLYRLLFTILGGFFTAKLLANKPRRNVIIQGTVGTAIAIIGSIIILNTPEMANVLPLWFSIALVITAFPSIWFGGKLAINRRSMQNADVNF